MKRRGRLLVASRWVCTALAVVVIAVLICGRWWLLRLTWTTRDRAVATLAVGGGVVRGCREPVGFWAPTGLRIDRAPAWEWGWSMQDDRMLPGAWYFGVLYCKDPNVPRLFGFGLFIPVVAIGVPTAVLWWMDVRARWRRRKGSCPACGYDRHGLAGDVPCPECGAGSSRG
jgi:hypothetical protein